MISCIYVTLLGSINIRILLLYSPIKNIKIITLFLFCLANFNVYSNEADEWLNKATTEYSSNNYKQALKWCRKAAEQGNSRAQALLGRMYQVGEGVEQDLAQAFYWFEKSAKQGEYITQYSLGRMYQYGEGVEPSLTQAFYWYEKAAEQGYADAQYILGVKYEYGEGVTKDDKQAVAWYRKAAEQGDADAQYILGVKYEYGEGVTKDDKQAVAWYRKAAEQGNANGQNNLGAMYEYGRGVTKDDKQAIAWYRKAAEQGNANSQYNLGVMYANGRGVTKDDKQAIAWYRKAAEQGDAQAQYNLREMYANDQGMGKILFFVLGLIFLIILLILFFKRERETLEQFPPQFRENSKLISTVKFFFYAQIATSPFSIQLVNIVLNSLSHFVIEPAEMKTFQNLTYLIYFILIIFWTNRANNNAWALGGKNMKYTPSTSVFYYFIPIVFIWKVYDAIDEIWKVSNRPYDWETQKSPGIISTWWVLFLITGVWSIFLDESEDLGALLAFSILHVLTVVLFLTIVKRINNFQLIYLGAIEKSEPELIYEKEKTNQNLNHRILLCPVCTQKIRFSIPLTAEIIKCQKCLTRLSVRVDEDGHIYVTSQDKKQKDHSESESDIWSLADLFEVLGLSIEATPEQVRSAYKKKVKEYHPDKVARFGEKLRDIAEEETKKINNAYSTLKEHGYA